MRTPCPVCGQPLSQNGVCQNTTCDYRGSAETALELPKADMQRRLGGAGLEFFVMTLIEVVGIALSPVTAFISGMVASMINAIYMGVKDLDGGKYSIGKRTGQTQVVDTVSGRRASTRQAILRNAPYIAAWTIAVLPDPFGSFGFIAVFLFILVDLGLIIADPQGRRLGDRIAKTQVVAKER